MNSTIISSIFIYYSTSNLFSSAERFSFSEFFVSFLKTPDKSGKMK